MTTAIIDYGSGNLRSAEKAFERTSKQVDGGPVLVTSDPLEVKSADRIVLPGVGAFADCRNGLMSVDGLFAAISERVENGTPFLGICVGMQLLASRGLEFGETLGFNWIAGTVEEIAPADDSFKVPHMGWNDLEISRTHPVLEGLETGDHAYFVHSFHMRLEDPTDRLATVDYAQDLTAIVARDNIVGTQFHPEKSQQTGLRLIANFLRWKP